MSSSQAPEIINLLEWENQCALSPAETAFIKKLETQNKKKLANEKSQNAKICFKFEKNDANQEEGVLDRLQRAKRLNQTVLGRIEEMKEFIDDYKGNVLRLKELKENLTTKINTLYNSSARIIEQQKNLMEANNLIKSYLQYYTEVSRLEKEIDGISLHLTKKEVFESKKQPIFLQKFDLILPPFSLFLPPSSFIPLPSSLFLPSFNNNYLFLLFFLGNLQRHLSEINDGIMFFQSKPKFQESKQFLDSYIKLKKKIIQIIKNLFLKIFNKHLTDANQNLEKFSFYTLFPASSPPSSSPRPSSTSPSSLPPPSSHIPSSSLPPPPSSFPTSPSSFPSPPSSLPPAQSTDYQAYFRMLFPEYSEPNNTDYAIKINQVLRNLLVFMENSSKTDPELNDLLIEIFDKYFVYYRSNLLAQVFQKYLEFKKSQPKGRNESEGRRRRRFKRGGEQKKEGGGNEEEREMEEEGEGKKNGRRIEENEGRREEDGGRREENRVMMEDGVRREEDEVGKEEDEGRREEGGARRKENEGKKIEEDGWKMIKEGRREEGEGVIFEDLLDFGMDSCFWEFCYFLFLFGFEVGRNERLRILLESINEKVYAELEGVLGEGLDELIKQMDIVKDREK